MVILTSKYEHTLDQKNRVFIPSKFRDKLKPYFTMCKAPNGKPCICIYPLDKWDEICDTVANLEFSEHNMELQDRIFENVHDECTTDSQGRVTIPADYVEYAGLTHDVLIIGAGRRAEIWDKQTREEYLKKPLPPKRDDEECYGVAF